MQGSWNLAWRNLMRNPRRTLLAATTVFTGGLVLLCSFFLADGIGEGIVRNLVAIDTGSVSVTLADGTGDAVPPRDAAGRVALHRRVVGDLSGVPGVAGVRTRLRFDGLLFGPQGDSMTLVVKGLEAAREGPLREYLQPAAGRMVGAEADEVYLSEEAARELGVHAGDPVTLLATTWGDQINALDLTVSGVFANVAPWVDRTAYVPLATARRLYAADIATDYLLDTPRLDQAQQVAAEAGRRLAGLPLQVEDYRAAGGFLLGIATANRITLLSFSGLLLGVVGLGIAGIVGITVRERRSELGVMLAMGFHGRQLVALLLREALLLAALATLAALVLGALLYAGLAVRGIELSGVARNAFGTARLLPAAHAYQVLVAVSACLGMALLGAWLPARQILRLPLDEVFRKG